MNRISFAAIAILLLTALVHRAMAEPGNATRGERLYPRLAKRRAWRDLKIDAVEK